MKITPLSYTIYANVYWYNYINIKLVKKQLFNIFFPIVIIYEY